MDERHPFPGITAQFALACCLVTLTYVFSPDPGTVRAYYPQVLLAYAPALYGINRLFLRRDRSLLALVALNGVLAAALLLSLSLLWEPEGMAALLVAAGFGIWVTVRGALLAAEGITLRGLILTLDLTALLLVLFTCFLMMTERSYLWDIPIAAGFAASVLGLTANRMGRSMGVREWALVGAAFLAITLAVLVLVGVAAVPAGQGLVALWALLTRFGRLLLELAGRLLLALASLFSPKDYGTIQMEPSTPIPQGGELHAAQIDPAVLIVFLAVLAVLAAVLVGWILWKLSRIRLAGRRRRVRGPRSARRRLSLWSALKRLAALRIRQIRVLRFLRRHRNQPAGLYCILVRRCRMGPWHKRPGETPREFLTRLHGCAGADPELEEALRQLIPLVDRALYAASPSDAPVPQAPLIRRRIGRAVRRQLLRGAVSRIRKKRPAETDRAAAA